MSIRETIYSILYGLFFIFALFLGIKHGFTDTHTPPLPFVVEFFVVPIGFVVFIVDSIMHRSTLVHKIGFTANATLMILVIILAFI
jgi:hypothetical protein